MNLEVVWIVSLEQLTKLRILRFTRSEEHEQIMSCGKCEQEIKQQEKEKLQPEC